MNLKAAMIYSVISEMGRKLAENVLYERGLSVFVCVCVVVFASMCVCVRLRVIDESNEQLEYGSEQ